MIRLGKLTDYGLVLMTCMAHTRSKTLHTARDLSLESKLPLSTVSKLLKILLQSGLLISHRGVKGGYSLARQARDISVAVALTECSTDILGLCELERSCPIKTNQRIISQVVRETLENVMLSDLVQPLQFITIRNGQGKLVPGIGLHPGRMQ